MPAADAAGEENDEELRLEENEEEDGPLLEDNDPGADSDGGLVLEENAASRGAAAAGGGSEEEEEELELQENEECGDGAPSAELVEALRVEGNEHFKAGRMAEARAAYTAAVSASPPGDNALRATVLTNRAAAALRCSDWTAAINDCTAALTLTAISPETRTKARFYSTTPVAAHPHTDLTRHGPT